MSVFSVEGHEPSILPDGLNFQLIWQDEFDGVELDRTKWDYRLTMMGKVHPAWTDKGVHLDGQSHAVFTLIQDENGNPVSSQLQTGYNFMDEPVQRTTFGSDDLQWPIGKLKKSMFTHTYGYYECRCRLQQKPGWWSAFWIQSPIIGASLDPAESGTEIDVMESFAPGEVVHHCLHTGGYGLDRISLSTGETTKHAVEEFHRFGVLWDENGYTFYIDGKVTGHSTDSISKRPEFILISTEVQGYRTPSHKPTAAAFENLGDTFVVDYVRVFDIVK